MEDEIMMEATRRTEEEPKEEMNKVEAWLGKATKVVKAVSELVVAIGNTAGALTQIAGASAAIKTAKNNAQIEYIKSEKTKKWHESGKRRWNKRAKRM